MTDAPARGASLQENPVTLGKFTKKRREAALALGFIVLTIFADVMLNPSGDSG